jgi:broad specificity phosphatase PhoE
MLSNAFAETRSRRKDKLRYRYPRGESYLDVIQRYVKKVVHNHLEKP